MLLSVAVAALVGVTPCNLSLLAPATSPALRQEAGCGEAVPPGSDSARSRAVAGVLGGALGSALGAVTGGLAGFGLSGECESECTFGPEGLWVGALLGLHVGAALGAHLAGSVSGGRGTWGGTVLGMLGGGVLGGLLLSLLASMEQEAMGGLYIVPLLMPAVGAGTGYALSEPGTPEPCAANAPLQASRAPALRLRFSF